VADSTYNLKNPFRLTTPTDSTAIFDIAFPNQDGETLNWEQLGLKGKVVILDVFGSWCPNCKDAAVALDLLSKKYPQEEIEIVPVAFELTENLQVAKKRVFKMQQDLRLEKGFLFGGYASKQNASAKFPMLNHIMSFPTIIVIDRKQKVRSVYTGFYGPGTGAYYDQFMVQMETLITSLLNEP
jgi:thiol-disulfide isomerase/thioredoxin